MKYFTNSVRDHIAKKVICFQKSDSVGHRKPVVIPAMPENTLLSIADALASYCLEFDIVLTLKIAKVLTDDWTKQGKKKAEDHDWADNRGSLTFYRNLAPVIGKLSLIVLCGVDRVTDSSGLKDFYTCDLDTIWRSEMGRSFRDWVLSKLKSIGILSVEVEDLLTFDRLLKPLLDYGRGDLLKISEWLENLDLNHVEDVRHALQIMLISLRSFGLPSFAGFPLGQKQKTLAPYIDKAGSFFNYTLFLEAREKEKALKAIETILMTIQEGNSLDFMEDAGVLGQFSDGNELLDGLSKFISANDKDVRQKLLDCDFVTILDKILKFRKKKKGKERGVIKLSGSPVEIVLTSVWQTLHDFYRNERSEITEIIIKYDRFKHDIEGLNDEERQNALDNDELAYEYLSRLIGGLENIVVQHLSLRNRNDQEIAVSCSLVSIDIPCSHSRTAEPQLEFSVFLVCTDDADKFRRKFAWRLPEHNSYRLSETLIYRAKEVMVTNSSMGLPVFHLPYYDELLRASSDEEIRCILLHCVRDARLERTFSTNLLSKEWMEGNDSLLPKLRILAERYFNFIIASSENGLLGTIFCPTGRGIEWADLCTAYKEALESASGDVSQSSVGMLLRAFLVIKPRELSSGETWFADQFEESGIVTILHPSLIEMLEAQILYLTRCFNYAVNKEIQGNPQRDVFKLHIWRTYVDLSEIQAPLSGLLFDGGLNLNTNVRGQDLIHRIGSPVSGEATLSTRLLLNYGDSPDDEELFSDYEMFRETSESKLLLRLMLDYFRLHPHTRDGLSLAVFRNKDIQPVIAALHHYLRMLANSKKPRYYVLHPERRRPYAVSVTIFTESSDAADVSKWIEQWKERWEAAEVESKYHLYRECRFSVAHRLVEKGGQSSFQRLINDNFEADIAVFYDFIGAGCGVNRFEIVPPFDSRTRTLKFPILEKACCTIRGPAEQYKRSRVISNRQFIFSSQHANLMHCLRNSSVQIGTIVVGTGDFTPWRNVIDALHKKTEWVICIDPNVDDRLIKDSLQEADLEREIIGFGSGVGTHGEDNYTISTELFSLSDVHASLCASIKSLYYGCKWSANECSEIAKGVLKESRGLSGLSLVRATGVDDQYIRDFMAYSLTRKILCSKDTVLCDILISLDAYRHWFDLADNSCRPDLMWLSAKIGKDKRMYLDICLIECKMAEQFEVLLGKARFQINNGLRVLMPAFTSLSNEQTEIEDYRPDRRFWWMQLHRLIASKAEIIKGQSSDVLSALEKLAEGEFNVAWNAAVFVFGTNSGEMNFQRIGQWKAGKANDVTANIFYFSSEFVKRLAIGNPEFPVSLDELDIRADKINSNVCDSLEEPERFFEEYDDDDDFDAWCEDVPISDEDENENSYDFKESVVTTAIYEDTDFVESIEKTTELPIVEQHNEAVPISEPIASNVNVIMQRPQEKVELSSNITHARIHLGNQIGSDNPIYWEFGHADLPNRHLLIFGASGMGKTYAIQCILIEMAKAQQNSFIVDYTNGFLPKQLESITNDILKPKQHVIRISPLPINPFLSQSSDNGGIVLQENANSIAKRIAGVFNTVYQIGDQQFSVLHRAIMEGVESHLTSMNLDKLLEILDSYSEDKKIKNPAQTIHSKIRPFVLDNPFSYGVDGFDWDSIFSNTTDRCNVFQLTGLDMHSSRLITEFVLWDLYGYIQSKGKKTDPKVLVLDEVQNLDHQEGSPLSKYLREGRKFGISLILATQTMSNMKKDEKDRMFNAGHKLFFKPADTEIRAFAEIAAITTRQKSEDWIDKLSLLKPYECYSIGTSLNVATGKSAIQAHKIKITSLEGRNFND